MVEDSHRKVERVQAVDRVFSLLERMAEAETPRSLSELSESTGLPMPTIYRLLRFLTSEGFVRQEPSKRYALGPRLIRLGLAASSGLEAMATPYLRTLVERFGESANMAMLQGDSCVYVAQAPSPQMMRMFTEVGRVVRPHCTGVGKAIMSALPDPQVVALLGRTGMPPKTPKTITSVDAMLEELARARTAGYAVDDEEQELGVRCVSVPVLGIPFPAAISVSAPSSRMSAEDIPRIAPTLREVAAQISRAFPGTGSGTSGGRIETAS